MVYQIGNISIDLLELLKVVVNGYIDEYSIDVEDFDGKGEGFVGDVIFVTLIKNKTKEKQNIIIKQQKLLNGEPLRFTVEMFDNEIYFYSEIWPILKKFHQDATGKSIGFISKCVGTQQSGLKKVALENLSTKGFLTYDKKKPFDDKHLCMVLETYGVHHAVSMAFREQNVQEYNRLVNRLLPIDAIAFNDFTYGGKVLKSVSRNIQKLLDPKEDILIEHLKLYEKIGPKLVDRSLKEGKINGVILHGDSWSNNFMFKYDNTGKLVDLRMLDFQLVFSGSPVFDLSYFIYSGGSTETFDKLDHYLRIYHSSLTKTLKEFGLDSEKIYSFTVLKDEWRRFCKYGYAMGIMLWNVKLADKNDIQPAEPEDLEPFKIVEGMQEEYEQRIKDLVLHMYKNDYF